MTERAQMAEGAQVSEGAQASEMVRCRRCSGVGAFAAGEAGWGDGCWGRW